MTSSSSMKLSEQQNNSIMTTSGSSQHGFNFSASQPSASVFKPFHSSPSSTWDRFVFGAPSSVRECGDGSCATTSAGNNAFGNAETKPNSNNISKHADSKINKSNQENLLADTGQETSASLHAGKFSVLNRWLKEENKKSPSSERKFTTQLSAPAVITSMSTIASCRDVPLELQGVSVKELVKAIGESRANGNGATPPRTPPATPKRLSRSSSPRASDVAVVKASSRQVSRSSSPVPIPGRSRESTGSSPLHSSPRATGISSLASGIGQNADRAVGSPPIGIRSGNDSYSDTSAFVSSLAQDMSHSPSVSSLPTSTPSTPRREPVSPKTVTQTATQTSPEGVKFNIGTTGSREENLRLSPKTSRKERSVKSRGKRDRAVSPAGVPKEKTPNREKVKEAMSPSVAECLRAIFAAFLWHEGIVHDAMACASYLKFHPDLSKQGTFLWKPKPPGAPKQEQKLTKEQKARQRHSVEVSTYSYLNVTLQNTEDILKPGTNANINEVSQSDCKTPIENKCSEEANRPNSGTYQQSNQKLATVMEGGNPMPESPDLPLVLRHVVLLWEELTSSCLKAVAQQIILPSPTLPSKFKKSDKVKDKSEREKRKSKKKSSMQVFNGDGAAAVDEQDAGVCELCGTNVQPHASDQHYRSVHPGCGNASQGCGFVGTRWKFFPSKNRLAQPCGEVVLGCYHMCWTCRSKFKAKNPSSGNNKDTGSRKIKRKSGNKLLSPLPQLDTHVIMRNNAMFLLDLASAASPAIPSRSHVPRRSPCNMPCVSELSPDNSPFPRLDFQCLHTLNCQQQHLNQLKEDLLLHQTIHTTSDSATNHSSSGDSRENHRECSPFSPPDISHHDSSASDCDMPKGRPFHRSISVTVGTSAGQDWSTVAAAAAAQQENEEKTTVVLRKRNNSSGENTGIGSGGSSLLAHPSAALEKLASNIERGGGSGGDLSGRARQVIIRPIMAFIFQSHDLETLAYAMRHATRKAAARVFAMQALNWLLRSVTQPTCLHDLLWCLVAALTPTSSSSSHTPPSKEDPKGSDASQSREKLTDLEGDMIVLEHPLSDVTLAGDAVHPLPSVFHQLLQTVADLMMLLPPGSSLQMMAVRCWGLRFTPADHDFLHQCHVFSNISKILSRSEEVLGNTEDVANSMYDTHSPVTSQVESLKDLTVNCEVKASSRQAMVSSLTDSSTETFWESGDEDRNKTKSITITCPSSLKPKVVYMHIDNCRDLGNKVSSVVFKYGTTVEDLINVQQVDIESRFSGWVHSYLPNLQNVLSTIIVVEFRGPDLSVRVRQVRIVGDNIDEIEESRAKSLRQLPPLALQHKACEQETLKVFRLITGQVFGKLISCEEGSVEEGNKFGSIDNSEESDRNNDLREHMVGILFSRSKLTHLQKQVCAHIVQAIKKEAIRAKDDWENGLSSGGVPGTPGTPEDGKNNSSDTYCFEMLSMVLALSGSAVGRAHLAQQDNLLKNLLSLLHTGSARVQRQVISLFRRMLVDIAPHSLAQLLGITVPPVLDLSILHVPTQDNEEVLDIKKEGILDVFLAIIAKALTVQVKDKGKNTNNAINCLNDGPSQSKSGISSCTLSNVLPKPENNSSRWYLHGSTTHKLAYLIIGLVRDMTIGKFSEGWTKISKGAIAENIVNLTKICEDDRQSIMSCLSIPTLWLALASLCVLHSDHVDALSSQHWRNAAVSSEAHNAEPRPTCENHDDGDTLAMILCEDCGNLCGECDRILHLNRRTRHHHRTVFREEQQAIKVDLHEGCGRTKLFWLLALADSTTLKAMLELRGEVCRLREPTGSATFCRFCGSPAQTSLLSPAPVCQDPECQEYGKNACIRTLDCGHLCGGVKNESICLPCLHGCNPRPSLKQDADDMCMICFSEALSAAPALQLQCGHVFHLHCCRSVLQKKWPGPRITFTFFLCPICKIRLLHRSLLELMSSLLVLYEDVRRKALMRLEYEGLHRAEAITTPGARYYNDTASYAMDRYAYYVCFKCNKAYYGGEARCDIEAGLGDDYDPKELVCGGCSDVSRAQMCPKHGTDFLEYKCRYCCSVAVFFCFGTTHFCNACHDDFQRVTNIPMMELPHCPAGPRAQQMEGEECPLHVQHPPTGEEFALGCGVCRNAHTF